MQNTDAVRMPICRSMEIPVFGKRAMTKSVKSIRNKNEKAGRIGPAVQKVDRLD